MAKIRAVVFDAYGTLFDVYSIGKLAEDLFQGSGVAISTLWRDKQIEYSRLVSLTDPSAHGSTHYQSFWELTEAALHYTLERLGLKHGAEHIDQLMGQYARLDAFPEGKDVLQRLKDAGVPCAILSNGSPEMLKSAAESAGLSTLLDQLISVDGIRQFKTHPKAYALASEVLGIAREEILFVSSNAWDALGATWYGFVTCWINRANLPFEKIGPQPSFVASNLKQVLNILELQAP